MGHDRGTSICRASPRHANRVHVHATKLDFKFIGLPEVVVASPFGDDASAGDLSKPMSLIKVRSNVEPGA
jgi:hypothetical protein